MPHRIVEYARLADRTDRALIATDVDGIVVYWGDGAEELYGWTREEALGRDVLDLTPTELSRAEAVGILARLRQGESWTGEFLVQAKDGSRFPVEVTDTPVRDEEGNLLGVIGLSHRKSYINLSGRRIEQPL